MDIKKIITEELAHIVLESITKNFTRAIETYKKIQLNQQDLRKAFVNEKDPKKKEKLKQGLIKMHSQVVKAEKEFNKALQTEPVEDDLTEKKNKGLWANIHAKRKRGEKPAHKNSKAHKSAVKAAKAINKNESVNEASDQQRLTHLRKFGIAPNNQPQNAAYIKQVSKPGKFFVDWKDAFKLGDVALEFVNNGKFDIIDLKTMKRTGKQLDVKKGQLGNLRTTYGVRVNESVNEDVFKTFQADDSAFKLHTATNTENRKSVKARKTDKTFDDGVPVLKYIARASKKDSPLPKGKFKIIEDNKHGWWYYLNKGTWYGIQQKDYGTPPFEY